MIRRIISPQPVEEERPQGFDSYEIRLGDIMRGERATMGKSLLDVQRELKVKATYIAAIENADPHAFETAGFIAGYVRSYARYLGMDPDETYRQFCAESNFENVHGMAAGSKATAKPERSRKTTSDKRDPFIEPNVSFVPRGEALLSKVQPSAIGSVAVLLALIAGVGYGGYTVLQQIQRVQFAPVADASGFDDLATSTEFAADVLPQEKGGISAEALDRLYRPEALEVPVLVARDGPIATIDPFAGYERPSTQVAEAVATSLEEPMSDVQVVASAAPELKVFAVRPAWVRISAADGTVIFEKILDAGEEFVVPQTEEAPTLRAGNSGAVYFGVNGETYGPAGDPGQVVSEVALSDAALSESYTVADLTKDTDLAAHMAVVAQADLPEE